MARPQVGILSMQRIRNYGSFLQAYGLKSMLESLGCDVRFVDYEPGPCLVAQDAPRTGLAGKAAKGLGALGMRGPLRAKAAFVNHKRTYADRFYPMLGLSMEADLDTDLDLLVIGSDEVFNCVQANPDVGYTPALFGAGSRARRTVSYAASFGDTTLRKLREYGVADEVAGWLRAIDAVSVRDGNSREVVRALTGTEAACHLDPVLAYDFVGLCEQIPEGVDEDGYLVVYGYSGRFSEEECGAVSEYAKRRGLKVLNIGGVQGCCDRFVDCSPFEAIAYFAHADAVVTDTFHGTIMSVITERPFAAFVRNAGYGNAQKLEDLLGRLGLTGRIATPRRLGDLLDEAPGFASAREAIAAGRMAATAYLSEQVALCGKGAARPRTYLESGRKADCTGCAACADGCPVDAIVMAEDGNGYTFPKVDEGACIGCGRCVRRCHMAHAGMIKSAMGPIASYGAYDKDPGALRKSASGGIATAICRDAVSRGGVAYGCVAHREVVRHERLSDLAAIEASRGSKYVQSDISGVYADMAADLEEGREVAFVGTPCQCAAMRRAFGGGDGLLLVDLVCEGVPSQRMYAGFLDHLQAERGVPVSDFRFRDKRGGWSTKNAVVVGADGCPLDEQPHSYYYYYYYLFARALTLRDSCYACPYACGHRVGDITVGDFWGAESAGLGYGLKELEGGVSCVLVNTEKGARALERLKQMLDLRKTDFNTIARSNGCLLHPSSCSIATRRKIFEAELHEGSAGVERIYQSIFTRKDRVKADFAAAVPLGAKVAAKRAKRHIGGHS